MNVELLCRRALEALVNGGYQGLVLGAVVLAALHLMRRSTAATRHSVCFVTLLLVALLPAAHFVRSMSGGALWGGHDPAKTAFQASATEQGPETVVQEVSKLERVEAASKLAAINEFVRPAADEEAALEGQDEVLSGNQSADQPLLRDVDAFAAGTSGIEPNTPNEPPESRAPLVAELTIPFSPRVCLTLAAIVAGFGLFRLGALGWQLWLLRALKRRAQRPSGELANHFLGLCREMQVRRTPELLLTPTEGPCAVGFWRPAVIIPQRMLNGEMEHLDAILRHEIAHIDRQDDWTSLVQQVIRALLYFHPAVWGLSRRLNMEREIACDDHVLAARPNRRSYALLLTEFAGQSSANRFTAAPAAWGQRKELMRRIDMILDKNRNSSPRTSRKSVGLMGVTAVIMAAIGVGFAPRVAVAQSADALEPAVTVTADLDEVSVDIAPPEPEIAINPRVRVSPVPVRPRPPRLAVAAVPVIPGAGPFIAAEPAEIAEPAVTPKRKPRAAVTTEDDGSVAKRLDRLEKMIEELVGREKEEKGEMGFGGGGYARGRGNFGTYGEAWAADPKEMARLHKEIERTQKEFERASKGLKGAHQFSFGAQNFHFDGKPLKAHRKVLEAQRKALEKQLESINERIAELEQEEDAEDATLDDGVDEKKAKVKEKGFKADSEEERTQEEEKAIRR